MSTITKMRDGVTPASTLMPMPCLTTQLWFDSEPGAARSRVSQSPITGALLLATDGSSGSRDAAILAMALARHHGLPLQILTVVETLPLSVESDLAALPVVELMQMREDEAHHRVRAQLHELMGASDPLGINIEFGNAAESIVRLAGERKAAMVVLGLELRERSGRWLAGRTARAVATGAAVGPLAVLNGQWRIPRTIVVGMDFSDAGIAAAHAAAAIAGDRAVVHLVHVRPLIDFPRVDARALTPLYQQGADALFADLVAELSKKRPDLQFRTSLTSGDVSAILRARAVAVDADLIAVGRHGYSHFDRFWIGSVTDALLRETPTSVLVTPPSRP